MTQEMIEKKVKKHPRTPQTEVITVYSVMYVFLSLPLCRIMSTHYTFFCANETIFAALGGGYFFCNIILWAFSHVNKYSSMVWFSVTTRYFILCMCHNLFNHSPIFGHLDCF